MPAEEVHTPWYVRVMLGIAGWLAASFLLGFVGAALAAVVQNNDLAIMVGFMVIAGAYAVFRMAPRNDFSGMFGLAVSFAGQALIAFGVFGRFQDGFSGTGPYWTFALIEAALAVVMPNFIHRVVSAFGAALAFAYACEASGAHALAAGVIAVSVAFVWLQEGRFGKRSSAALPIGYGLTLALIQVEGMASWRHSLAMLLQEKPMLGASPWIGEALVAAALLASVWVLLRRGGWMPGEGRTLLAFAATAMVGAASFKAPGIAAGLMIVVLGFGNGNRVLTGLGIASLLFYVSTYYYLLHATLLAKSVVLAATGAVLLGVRWVVLSFVMPGEAGDA
jgi:uncharacterized membrane protein